MNPHEVAEILNRPISQELLARDSGTYRRLVDIQKSLAESVGIGG